MENVSHSLIEADPERARQESDEPAQLRLQISNLTRERDQLLAVVDILQEISSTLHFSEILQRIARKLGDMFGLDRSSIFLAGDGGAQVRLVATYEDPSLRNLVVDLDRYPELRQAFDSGEPVFIPDAVNDPMLAQVRENLDLRNVRSIVVVPIRWRTSTIGAIFLRTERGSVPFAESDVEFCQVIASLTATALRNAHRYESLQRENGDRVARERRAELERIAMMAFLRRLFDRYATSDDHVWAETLLPRASDGELDRLVSVAMQVVSEEATG
jgi:GAF domain-containing protein